MARTGRPKKEPQTSCRIKVKDNLRVCDAAAKCGLSIPDYLNRLIEKDCLENNITHGMEDETVAINKPDRDDGNGISALA